MMGDWCKHYRAIADHETCLAGIAFADVRGKGVRPGWEWPCFVDGQHLDCPARQMPTAEEVKAEREAIRRVSEQFLMSIAAGVCPHCQRAIEQTEQVGWCIYARPCGCRLMQGRISDGEGEVKS